MQKHIIPLVQKGVVPLLSHVTLTQLIRAVSQSHFTAGRESTGNQKHFPSRPSKIMSEAEAEERKRHEEHRRQLDQVEELLRAQPDNTELLQLKKV